MGIALGHNRMKYSRYCEYQDCKAIAEFLKVQLARPGVCDGHAVSAIPLCIYYAMVKGTLGLTMVFISCGSVRYITAVHYPSSAGLASQRRLEMASSSVWKFRWHSVLPVRCLDGYLGDWRYWIT